MSHGNLAPQMASLLGNSYSGAGGPLSQNQFQAGNNHLGSMALLSELNRDHSFDMNDFPQLSGHLSSAGGSQRQLGIVATDLYHTCIILPFNVFYCLKWGNVFAYM